MPGITKNLLGRTFGRLEVIGPAEWAVKKRGDKTERAARWTVQCSCNGKVFPVAASALLSEQTKSCGCLKADLARDEARAQEDMALFEGAGQDKSWEVVKVPLFGAPAPPKPAYRGPNRVE